MNEKILKSKRAAKIRTRNYRTNQQFRRSSPNSEYSSDSESENNKNAKPPKVDEVNESIASMDVEFVQENAFNELVNTVMLFMIDFLLIMKIAMILIIAVMIKK